LSTPVSGSSLETLSLSISRDYSSMAGQRLRTRILPVFHSECWWHAEGATARSVGMIHRKFFHLQGPDGSLSCRMTARAALYPVARAAIGRGYETERSLRLSENLQSIRSFRSSFPEYERAVVSLMKTHPALLSKLYSDCQNFAEMEIKSLLDGFDSSRKPEAKRPKILPAKIAVFISGYSHLTVSDPSHPRDMPS